MPTKKKASKARKGATAVVALACIEVSNKSYGNALKGTKVYYEGPRPSALKDDGSIQFGKNLLEILGKQFKQKFRLILTEKTDSIDLSGNAVADVRISMQMLNRMKSEKFERDRDTKNDIIKRRFCLAFPSYFPDPPPAPYIIGAISKLLSPGVAKKMSSKDKEALNSFLPEYFAEEAMSTVALKAATQIETLKDLASDLRREMGTTHAESWWQSYVQSKILLMQQGYIQALEKLNVSIGNTKFPDFALVTHDSYLDILEIKKPDTPLLKHDAGRGNFFWDAEVSRAVVQLENYLENVSKHATDLRGYIKDNYDIDLKVVRPRGIILAGDASSFTGHKQKDDFRLLSQGLKNIQIVTYDELHTRLENYITVLERFSAPPKAASNKTTTKK